MKKLLLLVALFTLSFAYAQNRNSFQIWIDGDQVELNPKHNYFIKEIKDSTLILGKFKPYNAHEYSQEISIGQLQSVDLRKRKSIGKRLLFGALIGGMAGYSIGYISAGPKPNCSGAYNSNLHNPYNLFGVNDLNKQLSTSFCESMYITPSQRGVIGSVPGAMLGSVIGAITNNFKFTFDLGKSPERLKRLKKQLSSRSYR